MIDEPVENEMNAVSPPNILTTAEELLSLNRGLARFELVRGKTGALYPAGFQHGVIVNRLSSLLTNVENRDGLGIILGAETGFILSRHPDTVRAPDVGFVTRERIERIGIPVAYFPEAPDLAVEVVSLGDTVTEVEAKAEDWINAGTRLLWVVSPRSRTVTVYQSLAKISVLTENDILDGLTIVPGFACRVTDLFQPLWPGSPPN
jgi:Uma2 family endonuclease